MFKFSEYLKAMSEPNKVVKICRLELACDDTQCIWGAPSDHICDRVTKADQPLTYQSYKNVYDSQRKAVQDKLYDDIMEIDEFYKNLAIKRAYLPSDNKTDCSSKDDIRIDSQFDGWIDGKP